MLTWCAAGDTLGGCTCECSRLLIEIVWPCKEGVGLGWKEKKCGVGVVEMGRSAATLVRVYGDGENVGE